MKCDEDDCDGLSLCEEIALCFASVQIAIVVPPEIHRLQHSVSRRET